MAKWDQRPFADLEWTNAQERRPEHAEIVLCDSPAWDEPCVFTYDEESDVLRSSASVIFVPLYDEPLYWQGIGGLPDSGKGKA